MHLLKRHSMNQHFSFLRVIMLPLFDFSVAAHFGVHMDRHFFGLHYYKDQRECAKL